MDRITKCWVDFAYNNTGFEYMIRQRHILSAPDSQQSQQYTFNAHIFLATHVKYR